MPKFLNSSGDILTPRLTHPTSGSLAVGSLDASSSVLKQKRLSHRAADPDCGCLEPDPIVTPVGVLRGEQEFRGRVSDRKPTYVYQFQLKQPSKVNLTLSGLNADVDLVLARDKNRNGVLDDGETVATSELSGDTEQISRTLRSGRYLVQVYQFQGRSRFQLVLDATPL